MNTNWTQCLKFAPGEISAPACRPAGRVGLAAWVENDFIVQVRRPTAGTDAAAQSHDQRGAVKRPRFARRRRYALQAVKLPDKIQSGNGATNQAPMVNQT